ncbi:glycoside hydrolase family 2 protein [Frigoribacterium salinisoli]
MTTTPLTTDWTVEAVSGPVPEALRGRRLRATVPGTAHTDLLAAGEITDPFDGDAEAAQQWIGDTVWRWRTTFTWQDDGSDRHDLVAGGLDTVARVELNGALVAETENQHRSWRWDVRPALVDGENELVVTFAAPVPEVDARAAEHGALPHVNHHHFNMLRKAAYDFGWDWGIDAATSGIWRPIGLESWSGVRVASVRPLVDVVDGDGVLDARVALEWADPAGATGASGQLVEVTVGDVVGQLEVEHGQQAARLRLVVPGAQRWWPRGHGEQPLYDVQVALPGTDAATWSGRVGFRTVELDTTPDEHGTPFVLKVNGEVVQVRGANWIPEHAFLPEVDRARYRRRVGDAVDAGMNLLRVWGGGIYESEDFYDACDEAGLLVWQDFPFACAAYAEEDWLAVEVEAEAREHIARLSAHASLAIWNGANENLWGHLDWGWREELGDRTWGEGYYLDLLPRLVAEVDGTRPYSAGSPFSFRDGVHPNDPSHGTLHVWDVWNERDYTAYGEYRARFVSEFGFQGPPAWSTLTAVVHDEPLDPYGHEMLVHQKADDGNGKLERGLHGHLPVPATIEDWHWATQLNQAAAVRFGIEHFRSLGPLCTGVVVWQLNDDWPVVSWAAVDFAGHRKPLWHALRAVYEPRLASVQPRGSGRALVLANDEPEPWTGTATLRVTDHDGTVRQEAALEVAVEARSSVEVPVPEALLALDAATQVLVVELPGFGVGRTIWDPAEVVDQHLDRSPLDVQARREGDEVVVTVVARSYARDVTLLVDRVDPAAVVDRGLVTLLAGEGAEFRVRAPGGTDAAAFTRADVVRHAGDLLPPS